MSFPEFENSLGILWRGPLDSCNYGCTYCPFSKRPPRKNVLRADRAALDRFVEWVRGAERWQLQILFTPYGEALIWPWYRRALVELSHVPHVRQVSIQTNGSAPTDFLDDADLSRVSLWVTYHPTEMNRADFVARIAALHERGTRLSVGMVASPARVDEAEALRAELPKDVPFWLNAQKPGVRFGDEDVARLRALDPMFELETRRHRSRGQACRTGEDVISVDGDGTIRRCHFVDEVLGNLYADELVRVLRARACPRATCECWIGYAHLPSTGARNYYEGASLLARVPSGKGPGQPRDSRVSTRACGAR